MPEVTIFGQVRVSVQPELLCYRLVQKSVFTVILSGTQSLTKTDFKTLENLLPSCVLVQLVIEWLHLSLRWTDTALTLHNF